MNNAENALKKIENLVFGGEMPSEQALSGNDFDDLLDARDASEFASPWTTAYDATSKLYTEYNSLQSEKVRIDKVREHIYKRVYNRTEVSDLASYISDDFDLILKSLLTGIENDWVNSLWLSYKGGDIPSGTLTEHAGALSNLI